jgi:hypothetical protein
MALLRTSLTLSLLALGLTSAMPAFAQSGRTLGDTLRQGESGGAMAPSQASVSAAVAGQASVSPAPLDGSAQEDTPTTPEGEEQPGQDEPTGDGDEQSTGDDVVSPGEDVPSDGEESASSGSLPTTGLELAALASIGLGLLAAGAALRIRTAS